MKHFCTEHGAESHPKQSAQPAFCYGWGDETCLRTIGGHKQVANEEIALRYGHIFLLCARGGDEIEYGRWTLHAKQTSHNARERAHTYLYAKAGRKMDAMAEEKEIEAGCHQCYAEDDTQQMLRSTGNCHDCHPRHDKEGEENGQQFPPGNVPSQTEGDEKGGDKGEQAGQCCGFTIGGKQEGQHGHDEYAKAEA